MSTLQQTFFGRKEYRIDPKGRIPLSSEYYSQLDLADNNAVVIAKNSNDEHNFLEVFSKKQWDEKLSIIDLMEDDDDKEWLLMNYVGTAVLAELDNQNRIRLPKSFIDYANIDKDVVFIGAIRTLCIWSKEELDKSSQISRSSRESRREKMNAARKLFDERGNR